MMFWTHITFSLLVGLLASDYVSFVSPLLFYSSLLFFTAFVDIDQPKSKIGRRIPLLSHFFKIIIGHRTFFHSLLFIASGYLLLNLLPYPELSLGFLLGTGSHLIMDALTKEGVRPFYPFKFRVKGFVKTGSILEKVILVLLILLLLEKFAR